LEHRSGAGAGFGRILVPHPIVGEILGEMGRPLLFSLLNAFAASGYHIKLANKRNARDGSSCS
jgi:hypothetical protein